MAENEESIEEEGLNVILPKKNSGLFSFEAEEKDLFSLNGLGRKVIEEGKTGLAKHPNGKINLASMVNNPSEVTNICPYCKLTFVHKFVLARHVKQMHEKHKLVNYKCPKCKYQTVRKDQMRSHYSVVHEEYKPYGCSLCNFRAPKSFRVTTHLQKAHNGEGVVIHDTKMRPKSVSPPLIATSKAPTLPIISSTGVSLASPFTATRPILPKPPEGLDAYDALTGEKVVIVSDMSTPAGHIKLPEPSKSVTVQAIDVHDPEVEAKRHFRCEYCNHTTRSQILMGDHVLFIHQKLEIEQSRNMVNIGGKKYIQKSVKRTPAKFSLSSNPLIQMTANVGESSICSMCNAQVGSKTMLYMHVAEIHPNVKEFYACLWCNKQAFHEHLYELHVKEGHPDMDRDYRCKSCFQSCLSPAELCEHIKKSHPEDKMLLDKVRKRYKQPISDEAMDSEITVKEEAIEEESEKDPLG